MASRGGLIALSVLAALLAVVVVLDGDNRGVVRTSRRLLPELVDGEVKAVSLRRGEQTVLALWRDPGGPYRLGDAAATVDEGAVADFLANLELLACQRQARGVAGEDTGLDSPSALVDIELENGARITLTIGRTLAAIDRVWLGRGARRCLVDGYAARALDRVHDDLRARRLFDLVDVTGVELHAGDRSLVLSGRPLAVHLDDGGVMRADATAMRALLASLAALRFDRFIAPVGADEVGDELSVRVITAAGAQELVELGSCPGAVKLRAVRAADSSGCLSAAALAALRLYVGQRAELFDRHLVGASGDVSEISFSSLPETIRASGHGYVIAGVAGGEVRAERAAVVDWLERIDQLAGEPWRPRAAAAARIAAITIGDGHGGHDELVLARVDDQLAVARRGEALVWSTTSAAVDLFTTAPQLLRDRQLLRLEPFSLRRAQRGQGERVAAAIVRGQLLEDWAVAQPAGEVADAEAIARLREVAGRLRAQRFVATRLRSARARVSLEFDGPGGGEAISHVITIGVAGDDGCRAELDGAGPAFMLSADSCAALLGPWSSVEAR